jgi:hypothetical protein
MMCNKTALPYFILNSVLEKHILGTSSGLSSLTGGSNSGLTWSQWWTFGFITRGNSLASRSSFNCCIIQSESIRNILLCHMLCLGMTEHYSEDCTCDSSLICLHVPSALYGCLILYCWLLSLVYAVSCACNMLTIMVMVVWCTSVCDTVKTYHHRVSLNLFPVWCWFTGIGGRFIWRKASLSVQQCFKLIITRKK